MSFADLRISRKLLAAFVSVVAVSIVASLTVGWGLLTIQAANIANARSFKAVNAVSAMAKSFSSKQTGMRGYLITNNDASLKSYYAAIDDYDAALSQARNVIRDPEAVTKLEAMSAVQQQWQNAVADVELRLMRAGQIEDARKLDQSETAEVRKTVRTLLAEMEAHEHGLLQVRSAMVEAALENSLTTLVIGGLIAVLSAAAAGVVLSRGVGRPVAALTAVMGRLAAGDHAVEIPARTRNDEIGAMARAVQTFKEAGVAKLCLEADAVESRRRADAERSRTDSERARIAAEQSAVVSGLARGLGLLAEGDLVHRLETAFAPDYEQLRADFNAAKARLQDAMRTVSASSGAIRASSTEISFAADDLARRTEQQAASLEETAAALDEITATVKKTADGARHAREVVSATKGGAERSSDVVERAVSAMTAIEGSSRQVNQIIGVIDEIAFQTNLLALNAGVEAARAGEAGRGFAVVASEVRALAQRSAEAAKEIKALISTSASQVNEGVSLVGQTGEALRAIAIQVAEVHAIVNEISASAQEQATGLEQVNTAVNQMDQVTQQNAAMVEESTAASKSLASETEELASLIARFKVGHDSGSDVQRSRAEGSEPHPFRLAASKQLVPAQKIAVNDGPISARGGDDWQGF